MPTITIQVGQCGNQVGQALFERLAAQAATVPSSWTATGDLAFADGELFRVGLDGRRRARAVLVDTEPKVVNGVLSADRGGIFSRDQCYLGQSGRGNNWAFGYNQIHASAAGGATPYSKPAAQQPAGGWPRSGGSALGPAWVSSTATEDPSLAEFRILEHIYDGIRKEAEEADACPNFMLIHSLAGGSGSGLGSRLLEHLRQEFPLAQLATASVTPRLAGDTPMQSLNAVMALSFLQAYADVVLLFSNQDLMDACQRAAVAPLLPGGGGGMSDINRLVAHNLTGLVWPLDGADALRSVGRIRDVVTTVAADPCTKMLETWTVHCNPNTAVNGMWADSLRSMGSLLPRADALRGNAPISTAGALLMARGYPIAAVPPGDGGPAQAALLSAYAKSLGPSGAAPTLAPEASLWLRSGAATLLREARRGAASAASSGAAGAGSGKPPAVAGTALGGGGSPSLTTVANRSSVVGLLENTVRRALALVDAGAYVHWYERHGCSAAAVREAAGGLLDVADCYRQLHRLPHDQD